MIANHLLRSTKEHQKPKYGDPGVVRLGPSRGLQYGLKLLTSPTVLPMIAGTYKVTGKSER